MDNVYGNILISLFFGAVFSIIIYFVIKKLQNQIETDKLELANKITSINYRNIGFSPISNYSFYDAFHNQKMLSTIQDSALVKVNNELFKNFPDHSFSKTTQFVDSVRVLNDKSIVMTLSDKGKKLLKTGKAEFIFHRETGKLLPTIRDSQSKKYIEQMKGVPANSINKLSKISNLIVNSAHIISAADMAKKIKILDKKVDFLLEGRKFDKLGDLEANYKLAQQILSKDIVSSEEYSALIVIHKDLMKLRSVWCQEIEYRLQNIQDPKNRNFFSKHLGIMEYTKSTDKNIFDSISTFESELVLIDFSLIFDVLVSEKLSYDYHLKDDLKYFSRIKDSLKSKQEYLTDEKHEFNIDGYLQSIEKLEQRTKYILGMVQNELDSTFTN